MFTYMFHEPNMNLMNVSLEANWHKYIYFCFLSKLETFSHRQRQISTWNIFIHLEASEIRWVHLPRARESLRKCICYACVIHNSQKNFSAHTPNTVHMLVFFLVLFLAWVRWYESSASMHCVALVDYYYFSFFFFHLIFECVFFLSLRSRWNDTPWHFQFIYF